MRTNKQFYVIESEITPKSVSNEQIDSVRYLDSSIAFEDSRAYAEWLILELEASDISHKYKERVELNGEFTITLETAEVIYELCGVYLDEAVN
jgi:hypothetical protein